MKVDGGKSLTSRGQVDWYGSQKMTRKFEQEYTSKLSKLLSGLVATKPKPSLGDEQGLENWIEQVQVSTWALKNDEVHLKQTIFYENIKEDEKGVSYLINQKNAPGSSYNPKWAEVDN